MKKYKLILKGFLGLLLLPIFFMVYMIDRFIWVVLCMGNGPTIVEYFSDMQYIGYSVLRVLMLTITILICSWLM